MEAGGFDFAAADTPRECARWKAAVEKLERYGLVECPKFDGKFYKVTDNGYEVSDQAKKKWEIDIRKSPAENI
ncbi:MAG: hypothetical protein K6G43_01300 [Lachnospiraceae bacterium]|nr:hypothetical protein [Lachnospiraceae bacterium]